MAIVFRSLSDPGPGTSCPRPVGVETGDLMIARIQTFTQSTVTGPAGWTAVTGAGTMTIWYKLATGAESSLYYWVGSDGEPYTPTILAYSGVDQTTPIDIGSVTSGAIGTVLELGGVVTAIANCKILSGYSDDATVSASSPALFTERIGDAGRGLYDYTQVGAGTVPSDTITISPAGAGADALVFRYILIPAPTSFVTADAGPDQVSIAIGNTVTLDGAGSSATETTIASYAWSIIAGPATPTLSGGSTDTATFTPTIAGVYELQLLVTGADASTDIDTIIITVDPSPRTVVAFPFSHNLEFDIQESLEYKTPSLLSRDVHEQRMGRRRQPRRELEYTVSTHGSVRRLLNSLLFGQGRGPYYLPIWADASVVAGILALAPTIPVDTTARDYETGQKAILWQSETAYELVDVTLDAFGDPSIGVSAVANTYVGNVIVAPCRVAYLTPETDIKSIAKGKEHQTLRFRLKWNDEEPVVYNRSDSKYQAGFTTYRGVELFDMFKLRFDWVDEESYKSQRYEDEIDHGGAYTWIPRVMGSAQTLGLSVTITDRAKFQELLGWWQYHEGRRVPLWVPTYQDDFKVLSIAGNNVTIEHMDYTANYAINAARRDVCFIASNGALTARRITNAVDNGADETLTLDGAPVANAMMSFLPFCRSDSDRIEINYRRWESGGAVETQLRFQELLHPPD